MWKSEDNLYKSDLSSYHVDPWEWTQVLRLNGKCINPLGYFVGQKTYQFNAQMINWFLIQYKDMELKHTCSVPFSCFMFSCFYFQVLWIKLEHLYQNFCIKHLLSFILFKCQWIASLRHITAVEVYNTTWETEERTSQVLGHAEP